MLRLQQQHTKPNSAVRSIYLIDEARARFEVGEKTVIYARAANSAAIKFLLNRFICLLRLVSLTP